MPRFRIVPRFARLARVVHETLLLPPPRGSNRTSPPRSDEQLGGPCRGCIVPAVNTCPQALPLLRGVPYLERHGIGRTSSNNVSCTTRANLAKRGTMRNLGMSYRACTALARLGAQNLSHQAQEVSR